MLLTELALWFGTLLVIFLLIAGFLIGMTLGTRA